MRRKTMLGAIDVASNVSNGYDPTYGSGDVVKSGEIVMPGGGMDEASGGGINVVKDSAKPTDELPGGGPGMQNEPKERPLPENGNENGGNGDDTGTNYLPYLLIGGLALFFLMKRK